MPEKMNLNLPWRVECCTDAYDGGDYVIDSTGKRLKIDEPPLSAYVVRAVNAHDELVKAMKEIRAMDRVYRIDVGTFASALDRCIVVARKALANAGEVES